MRPKKEDWSISRWCYNIKQNQYWQTSLIMVRLSTGLSSVGAGRQAKLWPAEQECLNIILSQIKYILWSARSMDQSYLLRFPYHKLHYRNFSKPKYKFDNHNEHPKLGIRNQLGYCWSKSSFLKSLLSWMDISLFQPFTSKVKCDMYVVLYIQYTLYIQLGYLYLFGIWIPGCYEERIPTVTVCVVMAVTV